MTWFKRPGRGWHYRLPDEERFVCGSFFTADNWQESVAPPEHGMAICRRCERLYIHAVSGALGYLGQSQSKFAIAQVEFKRYQKHNPRRALRMS